MSSFHFVSRFSDVRISVAYEGSILVGKLELITTVINIKLFIAETLVKTHSGYISVWNWESMRFHNDCPQAWCSFVPMQGKESRA